MMISKIGGNSTNFKAGVRIEAVNNTHRKYLYNEMLDTVKKHHIPAVFDNKGITLNNITTKVKNTLKKLKINYTDVKKS